MNAMTQPDLLDLKVRDNTGQRPYRIQGLPVNTPIGDLVRELVSRMSLPSRDKSGRENAYHAYLAREARHLHGDERVGDALVDEDELVLHAEVQAG